MNTKDYIVDSTITMFCPSDDRLIYIKKHNGQIVGLNFMQGDEYDEFIENYAYIDLKLTKFYHAIERHLSGAIEVDRINQAMWAYHSFIND